MTLAQRGAGWRRRSYAVLREHVIGAFSAFLKVELHMMHTYRMRAVYPPGAHVCGICVLLKGRLRGGRSATCSCGRQACWCEAAAHTAAPVRRSRSSPAAAGGSTPTALRRSAAGSGAVTRCHRARGGFSCRMRGRVDGVSCGRGGTAADGQKAPFDRSAEAAGTGAGAWTGSSNSHLRQRPLVCWPKRKFEMSLQVTQSRSAATGTSSWSQGLWLRATTVAESVLMRRPVTSDVVRHGGSSGTAIRGFPYGLSGAGAHRPSFP